MSIESMDKLTELLCSQDLSSVKQGSDLWLQSHDEEITTALLEGLVVTPDGDAPFYFDEPGPLSAARWEVQAAFPVLVQRGLLSELTIINLSESPLTDLSSIRGLPSLKTLTLPYHGSVWEELCGFDGLLACTQLTEIGVNKLSFDSLPEELVSRLEGLTLFYDEEGEEIPDLSAAVSLRYLELDECAELLSIEEVSHLKNLEDLTIFNGFSIDELDPISELGSLRKLRLVACSGCWDFGPVGDLVSLEWLTISHTRAFEDLGWACALTNLDRLSLYECTALYDIDDIVELISLTRLELNNCTSITDGSPLSDLTGLQYLSLNRTNIDSVEFVERLEYLETLYLVGCSELIDIPCLDGLSNLKLINVNGCSSLSDASIANLQSLADNGCRVFGL